MIENTNRRRKGTHMIVLAASAGGIDPIRDFLKALDPDLPCFIVVIMHLSPDNESYLAGILSRSTKLDVIQPEGPLVAEQGKVYVISPRREFTYKNSTLNIKKLDPEPVAHTIDRFLNSLDTRSLEKTFCVILSGTGSDGSEGIANVKRGGGAVFVQNPETAEHPQMPQNAIATGLADFIDTPVNIAARIKEMINEPTVSLPEMLTPMSYVDKILRIVKTKSKYDFKPYKISTVERRIQRRIGLTGARSAEDYISLLNKGTREVDNLVSDLLISVTEFFRDKEVWDKVVLDIVPSIIHSKAEGENIRVWVPGCASGEEAYTIAMILETSIRNSNKKINYSIFATDIDQFALEHARSGYYPIPALESMPAQYKKDYFVLAGDTFKVSKQLREKIIFSDQNLLEDPPFSKLDMISCRNLMIYFGNAAQKRAISMFHFALSKGGYLVLGTSETVSENSDLFDEISRKHRIYRRLDRVQRRVDLPFYSRRERMETKDERKINTIRMRPEHFLKEQLLGYYGDTAILVSKKGEVHFFYGRTDILFNMPEGEPTNDLFEVLKKPLRTKIRGGFQRVFRNGEQIELSPMKWETPEGDKKLHISLFPASDPYSDYDSCIIVFHLSELPENLANFEIEPREQNDLMQQLELELDATKRDLQSTIEELETSNEELKSTNEEILSVNEELQSSNEELETSQEELQSLNEELKTVNIQLKDKIDELEESNNDLRNFMSSSEIATIFLDNDLNIRRFTPAFRSLFNIIDSDNGRPISDITSMILDVDIEGSAKKVLSTLTPDDTEVRTKDNRYYLQRILPYRTDENRITGCVVSFFDITSLKESELRAKQSELRHRQLFENMLNFVIVYEPIDQGEHFIIKDLNEKSLSITGIDMENIKGRIAEELFPEIHNSAIIDHLREVNRTGEPLTVSDVFYSDKRIELWMNAQYYKLPSGEIVSVLEDITDSKKAKDNLIESEERFRTMAESIPDIFWMVRLEENGSRLEYISPAVESILGIKRYDILEDPNLWKNSILPEDKIEVDRAFERFTKGDTFNVIYRVKDCEGKIHWINDSAVRIGRNGDTRFVGLATDITKDMEHRLEMEKNRQLLNDMGNTALIGGWEVFNGDEFLHWTEQTRRIHKLPEGVRITVDEAIEFYHPDDRHIVVNALENSMQTGDDFAFELRFIDAEKNTLWVHAIGMVEMKDDQWYRLFGTFQNITQRKEMELKIRESQERYKALVDSLQEGIWEIDTMGNTTFVNPKMADMLGYHPAQMQGRHVKEFISPTRYKDFDNLFVERMDGQSAQHEFTFTHKSGKDVDVLIEATPFFDELGKTLGALAGVVDITEKKRQERERQELQTRLARTQKMESIGMLAGGIAHDFNNLLTPIIAYSELLMMDLPNDKHRELTGIINAAKKAKKLTWQLLAYGRRQILDFKVIDLNLVLSNLLEMLQRTIKENIEIVVNLSPNIHSIRADLSQMEQIIMNLAANAQDAMPDGGILKLETEAICMKNDREIPDGEYCILRISDNGKGMEEDVLEKIFEPFFTTGNRSDSTGLGLATVYGIVEQHQGYIRVRSKPHEGSSFSIYFPLATVDEDQNQDDQGSDSQIDGSGKSILVVEDNDLVRTLTAGILKRQNFEVVTAANPKEALEILEGKNFALMLSDVIMPGMSGIELAEKVKMSMPDIKVVFMTGYSEELIGREGLMDEKATYIKKPFTLSDLLQKLANVLNADK